MLNSSKKIKVLIKDNPNTEIELTAAVLAYEIARADGEISDSELSIILKK